MDWCSFFSFFSNFHFLKAAVTSFSLLLELFPFATTLSTFCSFTLSRWSDDLTSFFTSLLWLHLPFCHICLLLRKSSWSTCTGFATVLDDVDRVLSLLTLLSTVSIQNSLCLTSHWSVQISSNESFEFITIKKNSDIFRSHHSSQLLSVPASSSSPVPSKHSHPSMEQQGGEFC